VIKAHNALICAASQFPSASLPPTNKGAHIDRVQHSRKAREQTSPASTNDNYGLSTLAHLRLFEHPQ
jgi:hypothetical protein